MGNDLLFALRVLRKNAGFTIMVILTLSLGIGANTAVFSVVHNLLIRSLPYPDSDRLVRIYSSRLGREDRFGSSIPDLLDWKARAESLESLEGYRFGSASLNGNPEQRVRTVHGTSGLLELVGAKPVLGRLFASEDPASDSPVAVLSYELWVDFYGSRDDAIGESINLRGQVYTIIGVVEPITGPLLNEVQVFLPWDIESDSQAEHRGSRSIPVLARLRRGSTVAQAQAELDAIGGRLRQEYPESNKDWAPVVVSLDEETVGGIRASLLALQGATLLILLIAVANISNLVLSRGNSRRGELAVRAALGASRKRLARLLMTESLVFSLIGGAAGIFLGWSLVEFLRSISPNWIPRLQEIELDPAVLLVSLSLTLICGFLFGSAPLLSLRQSFPAEGIRLSGRQFDMGKNWFQSLLVVTQLALSLILLTGSGLMIRSFMELRGVPIGIDYDHIVTFNAGGLSIGNFANRPARLQEYRQIAENLRSLPGVKAVTITSQAPLSGGWGASDVEVSSGVHRGEEMEVDMIGVEPDFFNFFGSVALEGRLFERKDANMADSIVVVDEKLADAIWPGESGVGQRIRFGSEGSEAEVIGVVSQIRYGDLAGEARPKLYNLSDHSSGAFGGTFLIRHEGDPGPILTAIPERVKEVSPSLRVGTPQPLETIYDRWLRRPRFYLILLGGLGTIALLVSAVGVYGVISYSVNRRMAEIGLRMALGARRANILGLLWKQTSLLLTAGLGVGLLGALWLTRFIESLLFQVEPRDPWALASMALLLGITSLVATLVPARRALQVDPVDTLRLQ